MHYILKHKDLDDKVKAHIENKILYSLKTGSKLGHYHIFTKIKQVDIDPFLSSNYCTALIRITFVILLMLLYCIIFSISRQAGLLISQLLLKFVSIPLVVLEYG